MKKIHFLLGFMFISPFFYIQHNYGSYWTVAKKNQLRSKQADLKAQIEDATNQQTSLATLKKQLNNEIQILTDEIKSLKNAKKDSSLKQKTLDKKKLDLEGLKQKEQNNNDLLSKLKAQLQTTENDLKNY